MGRKRKGFNTPFADLKLPENKLEKQPEKAPPTATKPSQPEGPPPDDAELFTRAMAGSVPVNAPKRRVEPEKRSESEAPDDDQLVVAELEALVRGDRPFRFEQTGEVVWGAATGVNDRIIRNLKRGHYAFRKHLDLHGLTREEAREELLAFIGGARRDGERCVLIITGQGKGSPGGVSVLREALPRWLSRAPLAAHVLAFCTAKQVDGGPGAFYALLRRAGATPKDPV